MNARKLILPIAITSLALGACMTDPYDREPVADRGVVITDRDRDYDRDDDPRYERREDDRYARTSLHDEVHDALERARLYDVSVEVRGNDVYLGGWVKSSSEKRLAHDVAHDIPGVDRVFYDDIRIG